MTARRSDIQGLTLLEVLAAVVVVGISYGVFFQAGGEMLRREGENKRRIQAMLLADAALAEIEIEVDRGLVPNQGIEERSEGDFRVEIETTPVVIELLPRERGTPLEGLRPDPNSLLGAPGRPAASALRRIDVRVRWIEGLNEREVQRTTFAFDPTGAQAALQSLIDSAVAGGSGGGEPNGAEDQR